MSISISIKKKYENEENVVYYYGKFKNEKGEFLIDKLTHECKQLKSTGEPIDKIMYLAVASKILKLVKANKELPNSTSYNS